MVFWLKLKYSRPRIFFDTWHVYSWKRVIIVFNYFLNLFNCCIPLTAVTSQEQEMWLKYVFLQCYKNTMLGLFSTKPKLQKHTTWETIFWKSFTLRWKRGVALPTWFYRNLQVCAAQRGNVCCAICKAQGEAGMSSHNSSSCRSSGWECDTSSGLKGAPGGRVWLIGISIWLPIPPCTFWGKIFRAVF